MVILRILKDNLPKQVRIVSGYATPVEALWNRSVRNKSAYFLDSYRTVESLQDIVNTLSFALEGNGYWLGFVENRNLLTLSVHGLFFHNPFRYIKEFQACIQAIFKASTVNRIEAVPVGRCPRGLDGLLRKIGFTCEGVLRKGILAPCETLTDGTVYSILRDDLKEVL